MTQYIMLGVPKISVVKIIFTLSDKAPFNSHFNKYLFCAHWNLRNIFQRSSVHFSLLNRVNQILYTRINKI